jgi:hypothetical protein
VLWACEKFVNYTDFGVEDADMDRQQSILHNFPKYWLGFGEANKERKDIDMETGLFQDPTRPRTVDA